MTEGGPTTEDTNMEPSDRSKKWHDIKRALNHYTHEYVMFILSEDPQRDKRTYMSRDITAEHELIPRDCSLPISPRRFPKSKTVETSLRIRAQDFSRLRIFSRPGMYQRRQRDDKRTHVPTDITAEHGLVPPGRRLATSSRSLPTTKTELEHIALSSRDLGSTAFPTDMAAEHELVPPGRRLAISSRSLPTTKTELERIALSSRDLHSTTLRTRALDPEDIPAPTAVPRSAQITPKGPMRPEGRSLMTTALDPEDIPAPTDITAEHEHVPQERKLAISDRGLPTTTTELERIDLSSRDLDSTTLRTFVRDEAIPAPTGHEYGCWPPPIYMIIISMLEITLFSIDASNGYLLAQGDVANIFIYDPTKRAEVWRFLTYMFVHVGYDHLLSNLLMQLLLGFPLELVYRWRIILVYLAGVVAGSLVGSLADNTEYIAGASSGVYALSSAQIAAILLNWSQKRWASLQLLFFIIFVAFTLIKAPSALIEHGAGTVTGLLVGIGVLRNLAVRKWEKYMWRAAVTLWAVLMVVCILAHIFWTERFSEAVFESFYNLTQSP